MKQVIEVIEQSISNLRYEHNTLVTHLAYEEEQGANESILELLRDSARHIRDTITKFMLIRKKLENLKSKEQNND